MESSHFFVYILLCADRTFYTGWTTDIDRRLADHNKGIASKYTRARLPVTVVYKEEVSSKSEALKREIAIKKLSRKQKEVLIAHAHHLIKLDECSSTNDIALSTLASQSKPVVVVSKRQSQGRGRQNRVWETKEGGLAYSLALSTNLTPVQAQRIPLASAFILNCILREFGINTLVKWPNDLMIQQAGSFKKIAGILIESHCYAGQPVKVVIGIGLNITRKLFDDPLPAAGFVSDVSEFFDEDLFITKLTNELIDMCRELSIDRFFSNCLTGLKKHMYNLGAVITLRVGDQIIEGTSYDLDSGGGLLVRLSDGTSYCAHVGEIETIKTA